MHEEGLINIYINKFRVVAVKAEAGEPFESQVKQIASEAINHISGVKSSDPKDNLAALAGRLKVHAEVVDQSQPKFRATIEFASSLIKKHIESL